MIPRHFPHTFRAGASDSVAPIRGGRPPLQGERAYLTLDPRIELNPAHVMSTGEQGIRRAAWPGRNTVDIGAVIEDVDGVRLSGLHTFPDSVLDEALAAQQRNPHLNLYLGIPPQNPQKYVLVERRVQEPIQASGNVTSPNTMPQTPNDSRRSGIVTSLDERPQPGNVRRSNSETSIHAGPSQARNLVDGANRRTRLKEKARDYIQRFFHNRICGGGSDGSPDISHPGVSRAQQSGSAPEERGASSSFPTMSSPESIQGPSRKLNAGSTPMHRPTDLTERSDSARSPATRGSETIKAGLSHSRGSVRTLTSSFRSSTPRPSSAERSERAGREAGMELNQMPPRASSSGTSGGVPHLPGFSSSSTGDARHREPAQSVALAPRRHHATESPYTEQSSGPTSLGSPIDWERAKRDLESQRAKRVKMENHAATRERLRAQLGLGPRAGKSTAPQATESSSPQPHQDALPILASITEKNKHAIATQALQRAIGTRPGLANEIQQRGWVGLLHNTLQAYDNVERARENHEPEGVVQTLEDNMRNSLRELLYVSNTTNVFNFGEYAPPQLAEDLDAFIRLPQFRTLVETVMEVHHQLEQQRLQLENRVAFASSSGDTYADQRGAPSSRS